MSDSNSQKSTSNPQLDLLIDQYLQLTEEGKQVDVETLCVDNPELAGELRAFISMKGKIGELAETDQEQTPLPKSSTATDTSPPPTHADMVTLSPGSDEAANDIPQEEMFLRYKLIKLLGQGAMGSVYLAEDSSLERQVALKIPKFAKEQEQELMARFLREARSAAAVSHPNICQVHDIGEENGKPFLTMAYIDGETLSSHVGGELFKEEKQIAQLLITLAHALDDAHTQGIIHRDLKPGNVMINKKGTPFITDFGLARKIDQADESRLTQEGTILGTPAYMSPEQIEGDPKKIGPQSDQYSLGVIFYELLTGKIPFKGSVLMMLGQILRDPPPPPTKLRQGLDKQLGNICLRMLEKSREKRYASCADVAKDLQSWIEKKSPRLQDPVASKATKSKQPASKKLQAHKEKIEKLIREGQLEMAMQTLEKMAQLKTKGTEKYVAWAKTELTKTKKLAKQYRDNLNTNIATAKKLIARHDYDAAVKLLQQIPPEFRNDAASELLEEAIDLQDEATSLIEDIRESLKKKNLKGIESNLNRLLELKPGNKMARDLHESLNTSGGRKFSFDAIGGGKVTAIVGGIAFLLMLGAITIYLKSSGRTVEITINDPTAEIFIDDNYVEIDGKSGKISLDVGEHEVRVEKDGLTITSGYSKKLTVHENKKNLLTIRLVDKPVDVAGSGGNPPDGSSSAVTTTGWTNLFNGKDLSGWKLYYGGSLANSNWLVEEGAVHSSYKRGSDLITAKTYDDFELEFEWKISKGGNSGVIYRARLGDGQAFQSGPEYQLLDDAGHPNGKSLKTSTASLYNMFAPQNKSVKPVGEWNTAKIVAYGNRLEHWLNGSKVLEADIDSSKWKQALASSNFKQFKQFGQTAKGYIALQSHGFPIWFRNIRIRELDGNGKPKVVIRENINPVTNPRLVANVQPPANATWKFTLAGKLEGHTKAISRLRLSPNGEQLYSGKLWDLATGTQIESTVPGNGIFLPNQNFLFADKSLHRYDLNKKKTIWEHGLDTFGPNVVVTPDQTTAIAGGYQDPFLYVYNLKTGVRLQKLDLGNVVWSIAMHPDGKTVWIGSVDEILILDLQTWKVVHRLKGHRTGIISLHFTKHGEKLTSAAQGTHQIWLWDVATRKVIHEFKGHTRAISALSFLPGDQQIVSGSSDKSLRLWDVATGKQLAVIPSQTNHFTSLVVTPDGKHVYTAGGRRYVGSEKRYENDGDYAIYKWRIEQVGGTPLSLNPVTNPRLVQTGEFFANIYPIRFSRDDRSVMGLLWQDDLKLAVFDIVTGKQVRVADKGWGNQKIGGIPTALTVSPDESMVAGASSLGRLMIWNYETGKLLHELNGHTKRISEAIFTPDGKNLITSSHDGPTRIWNIATGKQERHFENSNTVKKVTTIVLSPDGKYLAEGNQKILNFRDFQTGKLLWTKNNLAGKFLQKCTFTQDGKQLATISHDPDYHLAIYDTRDGQLIRQMTHQAVKLSTPMKLQYTSNDQLLLSVHMSGNDKQNYSALLIWDVKTGRLLQKLEDTKDFDISSDGLTIITRDHLTPATRVWQLETNPVTIGNDYDNIATGKWVDVFKADPPKNVKGKVTFKDGVLELNSGMVKFREITGRNMLIRARVKNISGDNAALSLRSTLNKGRYTAGTILSEHFVITAPKDKKIYFLKRMPSDRTDIITDKEGFVEVTFAAIDDRLSMYVSGKKILETTDNTLAEGSPSVGVHQGHALFKDVQVMLLDTK